MNDDWIRRTLVRLTTTHERGEHGATILEYAVIIALLSIAAVSVMALLGDDVLAMFQSAEFDVP